MPSLLRGGEERAVVRRPWCAAPGAVRFPRSWSQVAQGSSSACGAGPEFSVPFAGGEVVRQVVDQVDRVESCFLEATDNLRRMEEDL